MSRGIRPFGFRRQVRAKQQKEASQQGAYEASQDEPPETGSAAARSDHAHDHGEQQPEEDDGDHEAILAPEN